MVHGLGSFRSRICRRRGVAALVAGVVERASGADDPAPSFAGPVITQDVIDRATEATRRFEEAIRTPAAVARRLVSRTAFVGLGAGAALTLLKDSFPRMWGSKPLNGFEPVEGWRVVERTGRFDAVVVKDGSTERSLLKSTAPLTVENDEGELAPVTSALVERADGDLETANSISDLVIEGDRPAVRFGPDAISIALADAAPRVAVRADDHAVYHEVFADADAVIAPRTLGFELSMVLRSPASPEAYRLVTPTGSGVTFFQHESDKVPGSVGVRVDGETRVRMLPPAAFDADGQQVATKLEVVSPTEVRWTVRHRGLDLRYPIYADPEVFGTWGNNVWNGWVFGQQPLGGAQFVYTREPAQSGGGVVLSMAQNMVYKHGARAGFYVESINPETSIYKAIYGSFNYQPALCATVNQQCGLLQVALYNAQGAVLSDTWIEQFGAIPQQAYPAFCLPTSPRCGRDPQNPAWKRNSTGMYLTVRNAPPMPALSEHRTLGNGGVRVGFVQMFFKDWEAPVAYPLASETVWSSEANRVAAIRATDRGAGLREGGALTFDGATVTRALCADPGNQSTCPAEVASGFVNCAANVFDFFCPEDFSVTVRYPRKASGAPDGSYRHTLRAHDEYGYDSPTVEWWDKVDLTQPNLSVPGNDAVTAPKTYSVSAADATAGVGNLQVKITAPGGAVSTPIDAGCAVPADGCSASGQFQVPPSAGGPAGTYLVGVTASDRAVPGNSRGSVFSVAYTKPPSEPRAVTAVAGNAAADVSWTEPASDGGLPITGYRVTAYLASSGMPAAVAQQTTNGARSTSFPGLTNGTTYFFKVEAQNALGYGPLSAKSNDVTPAAPPGPPRNVVAVAGDQQASVTWSEPLDNGGQPIDGYEVVAYRNSDNQEVSRTPAGLDRSQTVTGLVNGTDYYFRVRAHTVIDWGPLSDRSNVVRPHGLSPGSDRGRLGLEHFFGYEQWDTGAGSVLYANVDTGNAVWQHELFRNPGIGLDTTATLTYNSSEQPQSLAAAGGVVPGQPVFHNHVDALVGQPYRQLGVGFSLALGTVTRLNEPLGGVANATGAVDRPEAIVLADSDGTADTFKRTTPASEPAPVYASPPGVHLKLQRSTVGGVWSLTRPDGVTFIFDALGYQVEARDRNNNSLAFAYQTYNPRTGAPANCETNPPVGTGLSCARRVVSVTDQGGRAVRVYYHPGGAGALPVFGGGDKQAGRIAYLVDHGARVTSFDYDDAGRLATVREGDVLKRTTGSPLLAPEANPAALPANVILDTNDRRTWRFTYTSYGEGCRPAPELLAEPCRYLSTIGDPRSTAGAGTKLSYKDYSSDVDPRRIDTVTSRNGGVFDLEFDEQARRATLTAPGGAQNPALPAVTSYVVDERGRPTSMTEGDSATPGGSEPVERSKTEITWTQDNMLETATRAAGSSDAATERWTYDILGQPLSFIEDWQNGSTRMTSWDYRYGTTPCPAGSSTGGSGSPGSVGDPATGVADLCVERRQIGPPTRYELDVAGNVLKVWMTDQNESQAMTYTPRGLLSTHKTEVGDTTSYSTTRTVCRSR